jgi:NTP pyrophosphatase (non-canonical NTP hydrolase)
MTLTFKEYQVNAERTAIYPLKRGRTYTTLGLASEAGEVAGVWKKIIRDKNGALEEKDVEKIKKELGDVLWYVAMVSKEFGLDMEEVALANNEKLLSRLKRGKLKGSGDDR